MVRVVGSPATSKVMSIVNRLDSAACELLAAACSVLIDTAASPEPPLPHAAAPSANAMTNPTSAPRRFMVPPTR